MKWEEKRYTPQELQRMQQEAVERVRQMQRRSEQAIRHSPRAPSFFVQDSPPKETQQQRQSELPPQEPVQQPQPTPSPAPQPEPRPQQQHPSQGQPSANGSGLSLPAPGQSGFSLEQVLDSLHLDHDRLLILALFFLLAGEKSDNGLMLALLYLFL